MWASLGTFFCLINITEGKRVVAKDTALREPMCMDI